MSYIIFSDGASRGNPGRAALGAVGFRGENFMMAPALAVFKEQSSALFTVSESIGMATNNEAEYLALLAAVKKCREHGLHKARCYLDSELVVRQLNGQYKVKKAELRPLYEEILQLATPLQLAFYHIPRDKNQIADYLANQALDRQAP